MCGPQYFQAPPGTAPPFEWTPPGSRSPSRSRQRNKPGPAIPTSPPPTYTERASTSVQRGRSENRPVPDSRRFEPRSHRTPQAGPDQGYTSAQANHGSGRSSRSEPTVVASSSHRTRSDRGSSYPSPVVSPNIVLGPPPQKRPAIHFSGSTKKTSAPYLPPILRGSPQRPPHHAHGPPSPARVVAEPAHPLTRPLVSGAQKAAFKRGNPPCLPRPTVFSEQVRKTSSAPQLPSARPPRPLPRQTSGPSVFNTLPPRRRAQVLTDRPSAPVRLPQAVPRPPQAPTRPMYASNRPYRAPYATPKPSTSSFHLEPTQRTTVFSQQVRHPYTPPKIALPLPAGTPPPPHFIRLPPRPSASVWAEPADSDSGSYTSGASSFDASSEGDTDTSSGYGEVLYRPRGTPSKAQAGKPRPVLRKERRVAHATRGVSPTSSSSSPGGGKKAGGGGLFKWAKRKLATRR
ncbi:hypothetical protein OF83DRAFT_1141859 [Amylostereum chailletii]|nr:hypothetical protein OF83DRAFT_1141859 [Amylostereum chailletii]